MIDVRFLGDEKVIANLKNMGPAVARAGTNSIRRSTMKVLRLAKLKVSGEVLKNRTGTLRRAINQRVVVGEWDVVGTVGIKLSYAAIHEFGGVINIPARVRTLRFRMKGNQIMKQQQLAIGPSRARNAARLWVFAGSKHKNFMEKDVATKGYKIHMPERSYLRSSLRDLRTDIVADLRASVAKAVKE